MKIEVHEGKVRNRARKKTQNCAFARLAGAKNRALLRLYFFRERFFCLVGFVGESLLDRLILAWKDMFAGQIDLLSDGRALCWDE
ncbi:MAG: hypothetical protein UHI81_03940 [Olegusella sp.]|nr:hypothetical protein [Olegusella sp.]